MSRAEQKGFYRFLNNEKVKESSLIEELSGRCGESVKGKLVLSIQDTTEINLSRHAGRLKADSGLGSIDAVLKGVGFKMHPSLVIDAATLFPFGWADIHIWHRGMEKKSLTRYEMQKLEIEEKESFKWIAAAQKSKEVLKQASAVIIVQDREADIYDQFVRVPDERTFLLIRSRCDRNLTDGTKLWDHVQTQACSGIYSAHIEADKRRGLQKREAVIEVRYASATLKKPAGTGKDKESVVVNVVEARETTEGIENPIEWKLITTLPVQSFEDACQVIDWYRCRWMIEEVFRVLKKEGFHIEGSELESGWAIRKLSLMIMDTVIKLFQMQYAYSLPEEEMEAAVSFTEAEISCLQSLNTRLEGSTDKQSNPYKTGSLAWASWIIARLGGWKGYQSQRPPGITTWCHGLKKFYSIFEGWTLQINVGTP
ncbi:IS4 family transposase [Pseudoflavitalea sp. X16]|nr:IS4 family transposase [Paraflavitalea devenefica]